MHTEGSEGRAGRSVSGDEARPVAEQLVIRFRELIERGAWDESVPSYRDLHETLRVSEYAVRRAFEVLRTERLVFRMGRGHAVTRRRDAQPLSKVGQARADILDAIANGELPVGSLVSQRRLARMLRVSVPIVSSATSALEEEGTLVRADRHPSATLRVARVVTSEMAAAARTGRMGTLAVTGRGDAPATRRVIAGIAAAIAGGELQPGDLLPAREQLRARYHVSRSTLTQAVGLLRRAGVLDPGARTARPRIASAASMADVAELAREHAREPAPGSREARIRSVALQLRALIAGKRRPGTPLRVRYDGELIQQLGVGQRLWERALEELERDGSLSEGARFRARIVLPAGYLADRDWVRCRAEGVLVHLAAPGLPGRYALVGMTTHGEVAVRGVAGQASPGPWMLSRAATRVAQVLGGEPEALCEVARAGLRALGASDETLDSLRELGRLRDHVELDQRQLPTAATRDSRHEVYLLDRTRAGGYLAYWWAPPGQSRLPAGGFVVITRERNGMRVAEARPQGTRLPGGLEWRLRETNEVTRPGHDSCMVVSIAVSTVTHELTATPTSSRVRPPPLGPRETASIPTTTRQRTATDHREPGEFRFELAVAKTAPRDLEPRPTNGSTKVGPRLLPEGIQIWKVNAEGRSLWTGLLTRANYTHLVTGPSHAVRSRV